MQRFELRLPSRCEPQDVRRVRAGFISLLIISWALLLVLRLYTLQIENGAHWKSEARGQQEGFVDVTA